MTEREQDLLAAIAAAPSDLAARQVYADWLIVNGDERGELLSLDLAEREGRELTDLEPLLRLSARHGFPRWPGDPDDTLLVFEHRHTHAASFAFHHGEHGYLVQYERRVLEVFIEGQLAITSTLDLVKPRSWSPHQIDVVLSILGRALRLDRDIATIVWPCGRAIEAIEQLARKRKAHYQIGIGMMPGRPLHPDPKFGVIDYERWGALWTRRDARRR